MEIEKSLQMLGLTTNEIAVYIYLFRKGISSGTEIIEANKLDKSSAYQALSNLLKKDLIYSIGQTRNQKFAALSPEKLLDIYNKKSDELLDVKNDIDKFVENISLISAEGYKNKNIQVFEGEDGFVRWAKERLSIPNSTLRTLSSYNLHSSYISNYDKEYDREQIKLRVSRNIVLKSLVNNEDLEGRNPSTTTSSVKLKKEVRVLPTKMDLPASLATFGDKVSLLSQKDGHFLAVIIDDKLIASLVANMFDLIWNQSKKV